MFRINKETKTITGELVIPYMVENHSVYCWDRAGNTIVKKMEDFGSSGTVSSEMMISGASIIPVTPVSGATQNIPKKFPVIEKEVSRPTLIEPSIESSTITSEVKIADAIVVSPDEAEPDKITYVHVAPAIDNYLEDGELQVGGVEVIEPENIEGRTEFIPAIADEDYI